MFRGYTNSMRIAYALLGAVWLLVILTAIWAVNDHADVKVPAAEATSTNSTMATSSFSLTSSAFTEDGSIPSRYTCDDRRDLNPPLSIANVPAGAKSLVLIMDDPDIPQQVKDSMHTDVFDHWTLFNIPPETTSIGEGEAPGTAGLNGAGRVGYTGPCPPTVYEPSEHRYFFKLYALDTLLPLDSTASKADVEHAMEGHVVAEAQLVGKYKRQ
jgi:Raf kinase inhibitor-like YbhB/YbcL family protein